MPLPVYPKSDVFAYPYGLIDRSGVKLEWERGQQMRKADRSSVRAVEITSDWSPSFELKDALERYLAFLTMDKITRKAYQKILAELPILQGLHLKKVKVRIGYQKRSYSRLTHYERYIPPSKAPVKREPYWRDDDGLDAYVKRGDYTLIDGDWYHEDQL